MTVRELIERLSEYPQDDRVVVRGYESGFDEVIVGTAAIAVDCNWCEEQGKRCWFDGRHGYPADGPGERVVLLDR